MIVFVPVSSAAVVPFCSDYDLPMIRKLKVGVIHMGQVCFVFTVGYFSD